MANNWTASQQQAITTDGCNILVSAAAGSGKTAVLVERIIKKITDNNNPVSVDRLVVVTFTKAAAAEMKQRIRLELDRLIEKNPSDQNLIRQQTLVNNARITTIDSFCLDIVRNYFTETDIDPAFRTADEGEIRLIENDVLSEMLEEYYTSGSDAFTEFVDSYGTGRDDSRIADIILKIYRFARSYPWEDKWYDNCLSVYDTNGSLGDNICIKFMWDSAVKALCGYRAKYEDYLNICSSPDGPAAYTDNINQDKMMLDRLISAETFEEFVRQVRNCEFDRLSSCRSCMNEEKKNYVKDGRNACKAYITKQLKEKITGDADGMKRDIEQNAPMVAMMVGLARDFSARCKREKRERNIIDFNDMEHLALDILVKNEDGVISYTAVADSLSDYYSEILIDEYQDSNMLQEQILTAVSKNRRSDKPNNVYMVGDVKQSIYRFRMACPELFMEKCRTYGNIESSQDSENRDTDYGASDAENAAHKAKDVKIQLQNNFRSRDNVLESVNRVFERIMTEEYGGIPYDRYARLYHGADYAACPECVISQDGQMKAVGFDKDSATEIHIFEKKGTDMSEAEAEAQVIGDIIRKLMDKSDGNVHVVADRNAAGGYRPVRYSDIVIISKTLKDFAPVIVNSLMNQGIPAYTENSKGFFKVYEIELLISFLTVIDNPLNDIPMAAVMMSYFGKMTSKDLAKIRSKDNRSRLYNVMCDAVEAENAFDIDEKIREKITALLELIKKFRRKSDVSSVYDLLWEVMYATGFYDYVGTMPSGDRRQANLDILLQRADDFEKTSYRGLFNFLRYIEKLKTYDVDIGEASVLSEKDDIVRVMSIHKSKGLEFPVCIVAGMGKRLDHKDATGTVVIHQTYGIGADLVRVKSRTKSPTLIKNAISMAICEEDTSEFMRVLYVAMTRAKEKLILTGHISGKLDSAMAGWQMIKEELKNPEKKYDYSQIDSCSSFLDMVMPAALISDEAEGDDTFVVNVHEQIEETTFTGEAVTSDNELTQAEVPAYPYELKQNVKSKVTVSELKEQLKDADYDDKSLLEDSVREAAENADEAEVPVTPKFLKSDDEILHGSRRGTAYHRIMELLDYQALALCSAAASGAGEKAAKSTVLSELRRQTEAMIADGRITKQQAECVDVYDIYAFVTSDTGIRITNAAQNGSLKREQPFVYIDDSIPDQLIQGVIDLYFKEGESLVIVDYKTDRVGRQGGEQILKERYRMQLDYYAKALSQITGESVSERIIYSFAIRKDITV